MSLQISWTARTAWLQFILFCCCSTISYGDDITPKSDVSVKSVRNSIGMEFVRIPAGEFKMGSDESPENLSRVLKMSALYFDNLGPAHRVVITKSLYMGKCEVTVGEFKRFVESTAYLTEVEEEGSLGGWGVTKGGRIDQAVTFSWKSPGWEQTDAHPVVNVTWNDAMAYCRWLSKTEQKEYRLPTEAEWEYACRAGSTTRFSFGDDPEELGEFGNVEDRVHGKFTEGYFGKIGTVIKVQDEYVFTAPVGKFRPNAWGLYDMHGNVSEWCSDWYAFKENYYETSEIEDPQGLAAPTTEDSKRRIKVIRGGSWNYGAWACLSASRGALAMGGPMSKSCMTGFRVVVSADPSLPPADKTAP